MQLIGPPLREALKTLTPTVQGNTLRLTEEKKCIDLVTHLIVPALTEARQKAERFACATNLSGMGKAILIYANDYEDKFPPNLETLVDTVEYPEKGLACSSARQNPGSGSYVYRGVDLKGIAAPAGPDRRARPKRQPPRRAKRALRRYACRLESLRRIFAKAIERDNEMRVKHGYQPKPAE